MIRLHPLGSGVSLHAYYHEVMSSGVSLQQFSETFAKVSIGEYAEGLPMFSISVFHGAGCDIPDPMEWFPNRYPDLPVKVTLQSQSHSQPYIKFCEEMVSTLRMTRLCKDPLMQGPATARAHFRKDPIIQGPIYPRTFLCISIDSKIKLKNRIRFGTNISMSF